MPTKDCYKERKIAQTLFLGASVSNYNNSLGWGSQSSQLTVNLIEDKASAFCNESGEPIARQFAASKKSRKIPLNHYHDCDGDDCYMLDNGDKFDSSKHDNRIKRTLGKVYYIVNNGASSIIPKTGKSNCVLSDYWYYPDPGFLGLENRININGSYINQYLSDSTNLNPGYDIINCPVYFKTDNFSFGGIIQSWNRSTSQSGDTITVNIEDMKSVLSNCYVILDKFSGAVYSRIKDSDSFYGGPRNWTGEGVDYTGRLYNGNVPNVFNVYGFLESLGIGGFGGANKNSNGISVNKILDGLSVLTSATKNGDSIFQNIRSGYAPKNAFSPFGRILTKTPQTTDTFTNITSAFNKFGIIPPTATIADNTERCQFVLDLSEIPRFTDDYRIAEPVISITDLITNITEESGCDYTLDMVPTLLNGELLNVIKVRIVSRNNQPRPNQIQNTVRQLLCDGYPIGSVTHGKEKNDSNLKSVVIGANQQRLLQVKSHRLSYTQATLILNSKTLEFVNYNQLGDTNNIFGAGLPFNHGKYRFPSPYSTNNPDLSKILNENQSELYDANEAVAEAISGNNFNSKDDAYNDDGILKSGQISQNAGNYSIAQKILQSDPISDNSNVSLAFNTGNVMGETFRFFPLFKDAICPFFGYVRDEEVTVEVKNSNNTDFRKIRPVYLDTWTGQICVLVEVHEFPQVSIPIQPTLVSEGKSYILVSESEIRAALVGFDNFLVYSLAKLYRPDLLESLRLGHRNKYYNKLVFQEGISPATALDMANKKYDWFWRQVHGNIAGPFGQPVEISPAKNDGSSYIDQESLQDLQILHQFINQLGSFYGKQYLVSLPNLASYKDQQYSYVTLPTTAGDCYVFHGDGEIFYNYNPVSEGAWEEPGNIIDDSIPVGGSYYYAIAEDDGRIGTLLGYNSSNFFDYTKSELCKFATKMYEDNLASLDDQKLNPAWSYQIFDEILNMREQDCPDNRFIFNSINMSSLPITDYINVTVQGTASIPPIINNTSKIKSGSDIFGSAYSIVEPGITFSTNYVFDTSVARDAWGHSIGNEPMRKLYVKAQVDPSICYVDPTNFFFPKAIVTSPGLSLTASSSQYKKDPNRTVIANVSSEDLILYLKTTKKEFWDYDFISYMLYYVSPNFQEQFKGNYASSSNESGNHVEIAPKAANPFFAGIPIRLNTFVYGPWANNVYVDYLREPDSVFPPGKEVRLSDTLPYTCTTKNITITEQQAQNLIDNFIGPTSIEVDEQLCPWNFGGSAFMDRVANIKAYSQVNYQNIIESAQIQMPGLPIFDLGSNFDMSSFNSNNTDFVNLLSLVDYDYVDVKTFRPYEKLESYQNINIPGGIMPKSVASLAFQTEPSPISQNYKILRLNFPEAKPATVITNIQVDVGNGGITSTYSLRTYTKKLSLFNKTESDKINRIGKEITKRDKQIASIQQQTQNIEIQQGKLREEKRLTETGAYFDSIGFSSKLFGWSPTTVLIGQAQPFLKTLDVSPDYIPFDSLYVTPSGYNSTGGNRNYSWPAGSDPGTTSVTRMEALLKDQNTNIPTLMNGLVHKTDLGMFQQKEIRAQLNPDYGMQSAMSLDGLFSPMSFYPTNKTSTYSYTKYDRETCPFCKGTKKIKTEYKLYMKGDPPKFVSYVYCDKCLEKDERLNYKIKNTASNQSSEILPPYIVTNMNTIDLLGQFRSGGSSSSSSSGSVNLLSLNPILVSVGPLRNPNTQYYVGKHPEGAHDLLKIGEQPRPFQDRCRHSIEVVARGAIPQRDFTISDGLKINGHHPDFYDKDLVLMRELQNRNTGQIPVLSEYQMNQRFMGLRGPLTMHAWGYDTDGYPVPNAADEPYEFDSYGRPRRFKIKIKTQQTLKYSAVPLGGHYSWPASGGTYYLTKGEEPGERPGDAQEVTYYTYENDLKDRGGFMSEENYGLRTTGFQGDIISKTQKWSDSGWSKKTKLKEFYLNFGERPDLWPVGPIDLRWDESRRVWTSTSSSIYKMVYITLEEDLTKPADHYDETFAARGFLDELEYKVDALPNGSRRLVYVKDKTGWTAPRGAKLLCRYDTDSGFYEPVSKPSFTVVGTITGPSQANISLNYVQGKLAGSIPTMRVIFENSLGLTIPRLNARGFFNYNGGKWVLVSIQNS